ncbi:unnamed protein product [Cuscuta campestris]|uniref:Histone acetyltransferase n=2 Tax=Cuscuta sect. Cleistogrammica TaxID=1824901 RepID=A0A484M817_9ASTE|nr:hypothetical protein DM860_007595 [Cuscuta australis]VFQ84767.1 unnamed protein product [Cuscuta campestris]
MPRPGPRPYECVRRAWHSDRHQPMRGSIIQEIFRLVSESHSSSTKKNREWQEKLPIVVLKAEEIMYFKANSEAEYVDLKTLWDRVNDAIDTIIRRDESTETGDLLQPCIEAALHLGCTPRKTTRSQRNISNVCYLSSRDPEGPSSSSVSLRDQIHGRPNAYIPFVPSNVGFVPPPNCDKIFPFLPENCVNRRLPPPTNSHSVYPLYSSSESHPNLPKEYTKCVWSDVSLQNSNACNAPLNKPEPECDLSLRLGPAGVPSPPHLDRLASSRPPHDHNVEEVFLKRQKVGISHLYEDGPFYPPMKLFPLDNFVGNLRNAGP